MTRQNTEKEEKFTTVQHTTRQNNSNHPKLIYMS